MKMMKMARMKEIDHNANSGGKTRQHAGPGSVSGIVDLCCESDDGNGYEILKIMDLCSESIDGNRGLIFRINFFLAYTYFSLFHPKCHVQDFTFISFRACCQY